jgi:L-seryl-tRNA(Ser) seleniumtransferase
MIGSPLASLPRVDRVVAHPSLDSARRRLGAEAVTRLARRAIDEARQSVRGGAACPTLEDVAAQVSRSVEGALSTRARPVINATGVVLHTNLGRAPLAESAVQALAASAGHYTSVEIDLSTGRRGARAAFAEGGLAQLTGAEAALVVNNNAAATMLALSALAMGRKVIVSRGELIEIGGGFRVPDVCARSGAELIEVGTTNRTRLADYDKALAAGGVAAILRVHPGNFRQIGFVERPELGPLVELAHAKGALLIEDLGGGAMIDLGPHGLEGEPTVRSSVTAGADVVCFSTDKVLGGPQGGAIVGKAEAVEKARRDPLARALRLGRLPLVALEATVALYLEGRLDEVPALAALRRPLDDVRARAETWREALAARGVTATVVELEGAVGGGALAEAAVRSAGVAIDAPDADALAARLRAGEPPVVGRIREGRLLLDARTVLPGEDEGLLGAVVAAMNPSAPAPER